MRRSRHLMDLRMLTSWNAIWYVFNSLVLPAPGNLVEIYSNPPLLLVVFGSLYCCTFGAGAVGSAPCPKWTVHSWRRPAVLHQLNMLEKTNNKWQQAKTVCKLMWLSWNRDTSKSSISMGFSLTKNHPFWGSPIYGNPRYVGCKNLLESAEKPVGLWVRPLVSVLGHQEILQDMNPKTWRVRNLGIPENEALTCNSLRRYCRHFLKCPLNHTKSSWFMIERFRN